jgi:hypothetical protein
VIQKALRHRALSSTWQYLRAQRTVEDLRGWMDSDRGRGGGGRAGRCNPARPLRPTVCRTAPPTRLQPEPQSERQPEPLRTS